MVFNAGGRKDLTPGTRLTTGDFVFASVIETKRLSLRPFTERDIGDFASAVFSNPNVTATLPSKPQTRAEQIECAEKYIDFFTSPWLEQRFGGWAVCSRSKELGVEGALLGFCGFLVGERASPQAEIGFGYSDSCWRTGVGYEAASASVDWFFDIGEFEAFYACVHPGNTGSIRILEKLGMKYLGDEDLHDSVARGTGLIPVYMLDRDTYLSKK